MRLICLVILTVSICAASVAQAATLYNRRGQFFQGDIQFITADDGQPAVKVVPQDGSFTLTFKLSDVASIAYRPPLVGVLSGGNLLGDWGVRDVGVSSLAGSAAFGQGIFELRGEGVQAGQDLTAFHFVWQRMPYQGTLIARLRSVSDAGGQGIAGLIVRQSLEPQSRYSFVGVATDGSSESRLRPAVAAEAIVKPGPKIKLPCWLKLTKFGETVYTSVSPDGLTPAKDAKWQFLGNVVMDGMTNSYIGMVVSSRKADELAAARFDHLSLQRNGLKVEFFADARFSDLRATHIDANIDSSTGMGAPEASIPTAEYWARWTGTLEPSSTDNYTFMLATGDAAQLWIDDQKLLDNTSRVPRPGTMKLLGEHRYKIRVDYHKTAASGGLKLVWQMGTQPPQIVPSEEFVYRQDIDEAFETGKAVTPLQRFAPLAKGVMLADGSFLPGSGISLGDSHLLFRYRDHTEMKLPIDQLARLTFQPLANAAANRIAEKGAGLLTQQGDFIEGECQAIDANRLKMNSVVFGVSSFDLQTEAAAIVFRRPAPSKTGWLVHTTSGGVIRAASLKPGPDRILLQGGLAGEFSLPWAEIIDLTAVDAVRP